MPEIDNKIVYDYQSNLKGDLLAYLHKARGLTKEAIEEFQIGYDIKDNRYTIPIRNAINDCVNIRKYSPKNKEYKMISYGKGYGENRLFPIVNLKEKKKKIILCEGEWDCMLLNQYGFHAVTNTCGVTSWNNDKWFNYFLGKDVIIIFDCDKAGRSAGQSLSDKLLTYVNTIKIIDIKLDDGEDITDWFVKYNKTPEELASVIKKTEQQDAFKMINISDSMNPCWYDKKIKFYGVVIGKDTDPYLVPKNVKAICVGEPNKKCSTCPLSDNTSIHYEYIYEKDKKNIVKMINVSDSQITGIIKKDLGLGDCSKVILSILTRQLIEDVSIIPEIDEERIDIEEYATRKAYMFSDHTQTNQSYLFKGTTWAEPRTQYGIHLITDKKSSRDSVSKYLIDSEVKEKIKIFQPDNPKDDDSIWEKLKEIYKDFSFNVTKIHGRSDIVMATDLAYHSLINFKFLNRGITKGWLECAVIGDTGTGKTETIKNLVKHYKAGEFITSGENTTRAGLLGGAQQHGGRWTLTWGKIPLNDRRLVVIDEADNLVESGLIGVLTGVRSSGIAEVVMVQSQRTTARTRIIWIANPLKGKVSEYNYGVQTVEKIFGKQQDIRRVDYAMVASKNDVKKELINKIYTEKVPHKYTSELCHARCMWAWNRKYDDVIWTGETEQLILDKANELSDYYSHEIPLFLDAEARMKIARMSVALAACLFSTDETGEKVVIYPSHIRTICKFLHKIYDNDVMGYRDYSEQKFKNRTLKGKDELDVMFETTDECEQFLELNTIQRGDIEDIIGCDNDKAKGYLKILRKNKAIKKVSWYYRKNPSFIEYLKKRKSEVSV